MDESEPERARRREFIRAHHPDRGGDPAIFVAGLDHLDEQSAAAGQPPRPRVVVVPHRPWPIRLLSALIRRLGASRRVPRVR